MASKQTPGMSAERLTKAQRAANRQEKARQLRELQEKKRKRTRLGIIAAIVVALALVAVAVGLIVTHQAKSSDSLPQGQQGAAPSQVTNVWDDAGIYIGKDLRAGAKLTGAPRIDVYFDYLCPFCTQLEQQVGPALMQAAQAGQIDLVYHPIALSLFEGLAYSEKGAEASYFMAEKAPELYLAFQMGMVNDISANTPEQEATATDPGIPEIVAEAAKIGASESLQAELRAALEQGTYAQYRKAFFDKAVAEGLTGTPYVLIDGKEADNPVSDIAAALGAAPAGE